MAEWLHYGNAQDGFDPYWDPQRNSLEPDVTDDGRDRILDTMMVIYWVLTEHSRRNNLTGIFNLNARPLAQVRRFLYHNLILIHQAKFGYHTPAPRHLPHRMHLHRMLVGGGNAPYLPRSNRVVHGTHPRDVARQKFERCLNHLSAENNNQETNPIIPVIASLIPDGSEGEHRAPTPMPNFLHGTVAFPHSSHTFISPSNAGPFPANRVIYRPYPAYARELPSASSTNNATSTIEAPESSQSIKNPSNSVVVTFNKVQRTFRVLEADFKAFIINGKPGNDERIQVGTQVQKNIIEMTGLYSEVAKGNPSGLPQQKIRTWAQRAKKEEAYKTFAHAFTILQSHFRFLERKMYNNAVVREILYARQDESVVAPSEHASIKELMESLTDQLVRVATLFKEAMSEFASGNVTQHSFKLGPRFSGVRVQEDLQDEEIDEEIECTWCHQTDHKKENCPDLGKRTCYKCQEKGHMAKFCTNEAQVKKGKNLPKKVQDKRKNIYL